MNDERAGTRHAALGTRHSNPELVDVVDRTSGQPTGLRKSKAEIHRAGDWHRSVHVWIVTPDRRILLQRRSIEKENHSGMWDVSSAGHVSAGEDAIEAAVREVEEELGIAIEPHELHRVGTTQETHVLNGGSYIDNEWHDLFVVEREVDLGALKLQKGEVDDARLVTLDELRAMVAGGELVDHGDEYAIVFGLP